MNNLSNFKQGIVLGLLWTLEIAVNNLFHPPLPGRDIFDDLIWAIIGLIILLAAANSSFKSHKILAGINRGFWLGLGSGVTACVTALIFIIFGMKFILSDPLVIQEWASHAAANQLLGMRTYFIYQTLAGAFLHLVVLGIGMGFILGLLGGLVGKYSTKLRTNHLPKRLADERVANSQLISLPGSISI